MNKKVKSLTVKNLFVFLLVVAYVIFLQKSKIYSPITYFTKISMPTTGMTRAWLAFLKFDLNLALKYHALFYLGPILLVFISLYYYQKKSKYLSYAIFISLILFIYNLFRIF